MKKNFTSFAFTESVKKQQQKFGTRRSYARMENSADRYALSEREIEFIQDRDSFYMATIGENGWPYVQHRGGAKGFMNVINETTLAYADFRGNGQYISTGNIQASNKTSIIMMNYPRQQRLKIWAESNIIESGKDAALEALLNIQNSSSKVEQIVMLEIMAFDWNCPQHITPRYTEDEISRMQQGIL